MRALVPLLILACGQAAASDPSSAYVRAAAHSARLSPAKALRTRYVWRAPESNDPKENARIIAARSRFDNAWRNFLSRESEMGRIVVIAPDLVAVCLDEYVWSEKVWERQLDVEPWFHVRILAAKVKAEQAVAIPADVERRRVSFDNQRTWINQVRIDGRWVNEADARPTSPATPAKSKVVVATAPWIDPAAAATLIARTQSQVPIVRADWWLFQTCQQEDRVAGYYDWLGIRTLQDWEDLGAADIKKSRQLRRSRRFVVRRSSVVRFARAGEGGDTLTGGARFLTEDFDETVDAKNPLRLLLGDAKKAGGEGMITLPNGLIGMIVIDAQDKRIDAVPAKIASDKTSRNPDCQVHAGSCMGCHREGFRPIGDWARQVYVAPFRLESPDPKLEKELRSAYLSDLAASLERGNRAYADALRLFGLTPAAFADAFRENLSAYADADVDVATLERWTGLKDLLVKLNAEAERGEKSGKKLDPLLVGLVQGIPLRIEHVEELVPEIYRIASIP